MGFKGTRVNCVRLTRCRDKAQVVSYRRVVNDCVCYHLDELDSGGREKRPW